MKNEFKKSFRKVMCAFAFMAGIGLTSCTAKGVGNLKSKQENLYEKNKHEFVGEPEISLDNKAEEVSFFSISREEAQELFTKENVNKSDPFQLSDKSVRNIYVDGKKYLVDANDIYDVFLADYESCCGPYYDEYIGVYYYMILKDGMLYYVNAEDFSIIFAEIENSRIYYYLANYSAANGGPDNDSKYSGYVMEIVKDGVRYLVDIEEPTKIIAYGFESVCELGDKIIFIYPDGSTQVLTGQDLPISYSDVLKRTKKNLD